MHIVPQTSAALKDMKTTGKKNLLVTKGSLLDLEVATSNLAAAFQAMADQETEPLFLKSI